MANLGVSSSGKLTLQDYFEPYEYIGMDAGDRDLGSGGVTLLDPTVFKGKNGVGRLALTIGKNGKVHFKRRLVIFILIFKALCLQRGQLRWIQSKTYSSVRL